MSKVALYINISDDEVFPFKITVDEEVIQELPFKGTDDKMLDFGVLRQYIGKPIDLVYCDNEGKTPMLVSDNVLSGITEDNQGHSVLRFNQATSGEEE